MSFLWCMHNPWCGFLTIKTSRRKGRFCYSPCYWRNDVPFWMIRCSFSSPLQPLWHCRTALALRRREGKGVALFLRLSDRVEVACGGRGGGRERNMQRKDNTKDTRGIDREEGEREAEIKKKERELDIRRETCQGRVKGSRACRRREREEGEREAETDKNERRRMGA